MVKSAMKSSRLAIAYNYALGGAVATLGIIVQGVMENTAK